MNARSKMGKTMSESQRLIYTGQSLAGSAPLYNMAWRFDLDFALDPVRFAAAFDAVILSHDALRTRFEMGPSGPEQFEVSAPPAFPAPLDFSAEADPQKAAELWMEKRAAKPFDLTQKTYDSVLIKCGPENWIWYFAQHHIATDAWSGAIVFQSVSQAYDAGGTLESPAPPQFEAFAAQSTGQADPQAYWIDRAKDMPAQSAPFGGTRQASHAASERVTLELGATRTAALQALTSDPRFRSLSPELTRFAILATIYTAFLARITGDTRISFGTPAHNRATPALKATAGLFIEMFPLSLEVEEDASFETLYRSALTEALQFLRHAKPGASTPASASAFHAVLNVMTVPYGDFADHPTRITWLHPGAHDPRHDLRLHVYDFEASGTPVVAFDLNTSVFSTTKRALAPKLFEALLDAFLADPAQPIHKVPLAKEADTSSLLVGPSATPAPGLLEAFDAQVSARPNDPAVTDPSQGLSYAELDARAQAYAAALTQQGVKAGDAVVVHARRSVELIAAIFGTLKTSAYFVPLPADTPKARLDLIVERTGAKVILGDSETATLLFSVVEPAAFTGPYPQGEQTAYVIYTSGSTGEPKGVEVTHQAAADYIAWAAATFSDSPSASYPLFSAIGFDLTITSLFAPLTAGGTLVVYPETPGTDLAVLDVFEADAVDVVKLTPAHLALLVEKGFAPSRITSLVLGGESLTTALCNRARAVLGEHIAIHNEYGPTEAVVGAMHHRFDPASDRAASVPIGQPADGVRIYVLDQGLNPCPPGVQGEIYIGGARLAKGYLGRSDLTEDRFIPDPFAGATQDSAPRMYKTGDLGRLSETGDLIYLGRADDQVKLGGVRVEPGEVAAVIERQPGIESAFVAPIRREAHLATSPETCCVRCGITNRSPNVEINAAGVCNICLEFEDYKSRAGAYFKTPEDLSALVADLQARKSGTYDAVVLLSGGKDSTYALYRFAELTKNILTLTLDNGYISPEAKENITRVTQDIGVDHRFMTTPHMNTIFKDSLTKHSNVCQGCFKTVYTLAMQIAAEEGIPAVVTGLSRGQFFETRLTPELFAKSNPSTEEIEAFVLDARKAYHRMDDTIARVLGTKGFFTDALFDQVELVDIYRYIDVPVSEIYSYLDTRGHWERPSDTGRSTNCLINDAGIYVHKTRQGFHNYALPYSWDVRMGHKTQSEATHELNDEIDTARVTKILEEVGFDQKLLAPRSQTQLVAYVTGDAALQSPEKIEGLKETLKAQLSPAMVPADIVVLDALPLTPNGKVDRKALPEPRPMAERASAAPKVAAQTPNEQILVEIFESIIGTTGLGVTENFYDIGGDSIAAIQIAMRANELGYALEPNAVFEHQTIQLLAKVLRPLEAEAQTKCPKEDPEDLDLELELDLDAGDLDALASQLEHLG
ncbi:MAG: amino acid adenylation domain-containing protein [Pseudomonadota bacterium]